MNINFHGIKNTGVLNGHTISGNPISLITMKLTNDKSGKDRTEFKKIVEYEYNKVDDNTVTISVENSDDNDSFLQINGSPVKPNNFKMISLISKLLSKAEEITPESLPDSDFLESYDSIDVFDPQGKDDPQSYIFNNPLLEDADTAMLEAVQIDDLDYREDNMYSFEKIKQTAKNMNKTIQDVIYKYLF